MFTILQLEKDIILIDKSPNVSVHKDEGDTMLLQQVADKTGDSQLYLVHRLDKMTSGILLLARNKKAASELSSLFAQRLVEKYYLAICANKPKKKQGVIIGDMARSRRSSWKLLSTRQNPAITQFFSVAGEVGERIVLCKPYTGKTHQIRVALKSVGSAIVGDPIYNAASEADRGYLHAYAIGFEFNGTRYRFVCPPTHGDKWQTSNIISAIESWCKPWDLPWPKLPL